MLLLAENADLLFSLPSKLVLDVESFMASKMAVMETPKGKVSHSFKLKLQSTKKVFLILIKSCWDEIGKSILRRQ
jgi:hypothetical protein